MVQILLSSIQEVESQFLFFFNGNYIRITSSLDEDYESKGEDLDSF